MAMGVVSRPHARLGPSSLHRWSQCPACIRLSEQMGASSAGPAALAGTTIHAAYERVLNGDHGLTEDEYVTLEACGVNRERARAILAQSVTATRALLDRYQIQHFVTEMRVDPGRRICRSDFWGTADLIGVAPATNTMLVADLKTGRVVVDPTDNVQLLAYAMGALDVVAFRPQRLALAIVQPPAYGDQAAVWETTPQVLQQFEEYVGQRAAATDDPMAAPVPSAEACQWCPARSICPAHLNEGGAP